MIISFAPADYPVTDVQIGAGDRVLLYTDGVTEAADADDEMFGVERLRALVARSAGGAGRLAIGVAEAATAFRGRDASGFDDDCTLVALEISRA